MGTSSPSSAKSGMTAGATLACAVFLLALPSAVLAITARFVPDESVTRHGDSLAPMEVDPDQALSRSVPTRSLAKGKLYPFTPANNPNNPDRSVTVAVRVSPDAVKAITVERSRHQVLSDEGGPLRIAPTAFSLGVSRGYRNFAQGLVEQAETPAARIPQMEKFSLAPKNTSGEPRFSPHIQIDEKITGRAPRTFAGEREDQVDVGGSYRLTKNLDVTAGVRYSEDRERLLPLTDGKQDNQAVYVGTQFRF